MEISREIASGFMQANKLQSPRQNVEKDSLSYNGSERHKFGTKQKNMDKVELSGTALTMAEDITGQDAETLLTRNETDSRVQTYDRYEQMRTERFGWSSKNSTEVNSELLG